MLEARMTKMQREINTAHEISGRDETLGKQTGKVCITLWERICVHFCQCPETKAKFKMKAFIWQRNF